MLTDHLATAVPYPIVRGRRFWPRDKPGHANEAVVGARAGTIEASPGRIPSPVPPRRPRRRSSRRGARTASLRLRFAFAPCAAVVLPRASAAAPWRRLDAEIRASGLPVHLREGVSISVVAAGALPRSPCAVGDRAPPSGSQSGRAAARQTPHR